MLELHHASISTCSQKVRLCLAEKNLTWKDQRMEFASGDHLKLEYLRINPNGVVPTLIDNGKAIIDSSVICEYLDEAYPESGQKLMPLDLHTRARMRAWLRYIEEVPTASIRAPSFNKLFVKSFAQFPDEAFDTYASSLPLRKHFYQRMGKDGFDDNEIKASIERLYQTLDRIDQAAAVDGWLVGSEITLADICVLPSIIRMEDLGITQGWETRPNFTAWLAQMKSRDSYSLAFYEGSHVNGKD